MITSGSADTLKSAPKNTISAQRTNNKRKSGSAEIDKSENVTRKPKISKNTLSLSYTIYTYIYIYIQIFIHMYIDIFVFIQGSRSVGTYSDIGG
jgi:hypothetical protein